MNDAIQAMLERYSCKNSEDYEKALKEVVQEVALMGLSRSNFFSFAAFYGGTALRIFYGLPRFSEDLDFSLVTPDVVFDFKKYLPFVEKELTAYGFQMAVIKKTKTKESMIQSAFIKGNTFQNILEITSDQSATFGLNPHSTIKIKLEIDTDPPPGADFQYVNAILPDNYRVRLYDLPSLFSGKIHAVLCRDFKFRVKGRDYYDYLWYLKRGTRVNLWHLQKRMEQSGKWESGQILDLNALKGMLKLRFHQVDFELARRDVSPFLKAKDKEGLKLWDASFFTDVTERYLQSTQESV